MEAMSKVTKIIHNKNHNSGSAYGNMVIQNRLT